MFFLARQAVVQIRPEHERQRPKTQLVSFEISGEIKHNLLSTDLIQPLENDVRLALREKTDT